MRGVFPENIVRIVELDAGNQGRAIVICRHIRVMPDLISDYCLARRERVFEDLATIVESVAYCDRRIVRRPSDGWKRNLIVDVPVYELPLLQSMPVVNALHSAVEFLTGNSWEFGFSRRLWIISKEQSRMAFPQVGIHHVIPFSDGLDLFAQARLSVSEYGPKGVLLIHAGLGACGVAEGVRKLRVPRRFKGARLRETSYRTRSLVFYTLAAFAAVASRADAVVIGENGQGALGPACVPFSDEWWFRSAHPGFVERWKQFLSLTLGREIHLEQPQLWKAKGEVLTEFRERGLSAGWHETRSCSGRPLERLGKNSCGFCSGCLLRIVAAHAAGIESEDSQRAFDVFASESVGHDRSGRERPMTRHEHAIAMRAVATMHKAAYFPSSDQDNAVMLREARLIAPSQPEGARKNLALLLSKHSCEWKNFVDSLPHKSWVRNIIGRL